MSVWPLPCEFGANGRIARGLARCYPAGVVRECSMTASTNGSLETVLGQFWLTLALVGIPGVLGGLTNGISIFLRPADTEAGNAASDGDLPKRSYYVAYAITGLGGSLAALLVTLWAG